MTSSPNSEALALPPELTDSRIMELMRIPVDSRGECYLDGNERTLFMARAIESEVRADIALDRAKRAAAVGASSAPVASIRNGVLMAIVQDGKLLMPDGSPVPDGPLYAGSAPVVEPVAEVQGPAGSPINTSRRASMLWACALWRRFPETREFIESRTGAWFSWGNIRTEWEWRTDAEIAAFNAEHAHVPSSAVAASPDVATVKRLADELSMADGARSIPTGELYRNITHSQYVAKRQELHATIDALGAAATQARADAPALAREPLTEMRIEELARKHESGGAGLAQGGGVSSHFFCADDLVPFVRAIESKHGITADSARAAVSEPPEASEVGL